MIININLKLLHYVLNRYQFLLAICIVISKTTVLNVLFMIYHIHSTLLMFVHELFYNVIIVMHRLFYHQSSLSIIVIVILSSIEHTSMGFSHLWFVYLPFYQNKNYEQHLINNTKYYYIRIYGYLLKSL